MHHLPRNALILALGVFALTLAACARRETPVEAGIRTQTLLVGNSSEPVDLDPHVIIAFTDSHIAYSLFEGLTKLDGKTSEPVPAAAERWDVSPDGTVYTFHLRPNARWSNGDPVTAADFCLFVPQDPHARVWAQYSYMLWPIKNAEAFNAGRITDFSIVERRHSMPTRLPGSVHLVPFSSILPYFSTTAWCTGSHVVWDAIAGRYGVGLSSFSWRVVASSAFAPTIENP